MNNMAGFRCLNANFHLERLDDDGVSTISSREQNKVEESVQELYSVFRDRVDFDPEHPALSREQHVQFLRKGLCHLSQSYQCLDASRPWLCFWILHGLELLDEKIAGHQASALCQFLKKCQHSQGGFGGGPLQLAHLAPTYAAVCALCIIGTEEAYQVVNRETLKSYLVRMKLPDGGFKMHDGGEADIRGVYCAAAVASLTDTYTKEMFDMTSEWVLSCQTYEGGFSGTPFMEAHGGYTFCGLATLFILGKEQLCDVQALLKWTVNRQMRFEGGFQGRTNKLVDGCYSFWQGGVFPLLHTILTKIDTASMDMERWLFHQGALQEYLLICCQHVGGGLIDKPGKIRDFYHTCYDLSGLSIAQHFAGGKFGSAWIAGDPRNELMPTHPIYNVCVDSVANARDYFTNVANATASSTTNDQNDNT